MSQRFKQYPTVHCHPGSLDTASTPAAFAAKEVELGSGCMTATDHGTMAQVRNVYEVAKKNKLTPILGIEAYVRDDQDKLLLAAGHTHNEQGTLADYYKYAHMTLHCLDADAFEALSRILSKADAKAEKHGSERKPIFDWNDIEELGSYNITAGSGCLIGVVQRHLLDHNDIYMADAFYSRARSLFKPGNFIAEVFPHKCDRFWESAGYLTFEDGTEQKIAAWKKIKLQGAGDGQVKDLAVRWKRGRRDTLVAVMENRKWAEKEPRAITNIEIREGAFLNECRPWAEDSDVQRGANEAILYLARKYGDKVVISDDSHFASENEKIVQDIRLQSGGGNWKFVNSYHRQSSEESYAHFKATLGTSEKEFEGWVDNNIEWASRFKDFRFRDRKSLPSKFYPSDTLGHTMELIKKHGRMNWQDPVMVARLEKEIDMLHMNGTIDLLPYFMVGEEVLEHYSKNGKLSGPGRGSAGGVLLAYLLRITHVNPIKYGLSMERFLTATRVRSGKWPDIDTDLPSRDLLVGWEEPGLEIELEDGTTKMVGREAKVRTSEGIVTVNVALARKLDIVEWL